MSDTAYEQLGRIVRTLDLAAPAAHVDVAFGLPVARATVTVTKLGTGAWSAGPVTIEALGAGAGSPVIAFSPAATIAAGGGRVVLDDLDGERGLRIAAPVVESQGTQPDVLAQVVGELFG